MRAKTDAQRELMSLRRLVRGLLECRHGTGCKLCLERLKAELPQHWKPRKVAP